MSDQPNHPCSLLITKLGSYVFKVAVNYVWFFDVQPEFRILRQFHVGWDELITLFHKLLGSLKCTNAVARVVVVVNHIVDLVQFGDMRDNVIWEVVDVLFEKIMNFRYINIQRLCKLILIASEVSIIIQIILFYTFNI